MSSKESSPDHPPSQEKEPLPFQEKGEKIVPMKPIEPVRLPATSETPVEPIDPTARLKQVLSGKSGKIKHQFRPQKPENPFPSFEAPHVGGKPDPMEAILNKTLANAPRITKKVFSERFIVRIAYEIKTALRYNSIRLLFTACILVSAYIGYKIGGHSVKREMENQKNAAYITHPAAP